MICGLNGFYEPTHALLSMNSLF